MDALGLALNPAGAIPGKSLIRATGFYITSSTTASISGATVIVAIISGGQVAYDRNGNTDNCFPPTPVAIFAPGDSITIWVQYMRTSSSNPYWTISSISMTASTTTLKVNGQYGSLYGSLLLYA